MKINDNEIFKIWLGCLEFSWIGVWKGVWDWFVVFYRIGFGDFNILRVRGRRIRIFRLFLDIEFKVSGGNTIIGF